MNREDAEKTIESMYEEYLLEQQRFKKEAIDLYTRLEEIENKSQKLFDAVSRKMEAVAEKVADEQDRNDLEVEIYIKDNVDYEHVVIIDLLSDEAIEYKRNNKRPRVEENQKAE